MFIEVPSNKIEDLHAFVARLNRKAQRWGLPLLSVKVGESSFAEKNVREGVLSEGEIYNEKVRRQMVEVFTVEILGDLFICKGWEFVASVEVLESGNSIFNRSLFSLVKPIPEKYRCTGHACQHCGHKRERKQSFILFNEGKNEFIQVGSTCIKDFLGHSLSAFEFIANVDSLIKEFEEGCFCRGKVEKVLNIKSVLKTASFVIEKKGFVSRSKAFESGLTATADLISNKSYSKEERAEIEGFSEKADLIIKWLRNLSEEALQNEYLSKLYWIAENSFVSEKQLAILVSSVAAYERAKEREAELQRQGQSDFFGEVKKRYELKLEVKKNITLPDYGYGPSSLLIMENKSGNVFCWKSSRLLDTKQGENLSLKGTVKEHKEFRGIKQTVLTRCKVA